MGEIKKIYIAFARIIHQAKLYNFSVIFKS